MAFKMVIVPIQYVFNYNNKFIFFNQANRERLQFNVLVAYGQIVFLKLSCMCISKLRRFLRTWGCIICGPATCPSTLS